MPVHSAEALVWYGGTPAALESILAANAGIRLVQLSTAGVESFVHLLRDGRTWTCAKGAFSQTVAEQALALTLGVLRNLKEAARTPTWSRTETRVLAGSEVLILGRGGIGATLARLLAPFGVRITVLGRKQTPLDWAERVVTMESLNRCLALADVVYVAVPLIPETDGLIGEHQLRAMKPSAILVNVARGRHIVTDDLVHALREGWIAGAGLDVTEPEPLPDGHPLWSLPNCLITSHSSNSMATYRAGLAARVSANVERYLGGRNLLGVVDPSSQY